MGVRAIPRIPRTTQLLQVWRLAACASLIVIHDRAILNDVSSSVRLQALEADLAAACERWATLDAIGG